jgi:hypothetical protein
MDMALFNDATEVVWKVADHLHDRGLAGVPPRRRFVHDADEAHRLCLEGTAPVLGMSLDDVLDCVLSDHPNAADVAAFAGVHRGFLSLMADPAIDSVAELRGKKVAVDTYSGYASALFDILKSAGLDHRHDVMVTLAGATNLRFEKLIEGRFSATLLGSPFDILAEAQGFKRLVRVLDLLKAYQGVVFAARRSWLDRHAEEARALLACFHLALGWAMDRDNRPAVRALLGKALSIGVEDGCLDAIVDRLFGAGTEFQPNGVIAGGAMDQVLRLFATYRTRDLAGFDKARLIDVRFGVAAPRT